MVNLSARDYAAWWTVARRVLASRRVRRAGDRIAAIDAGRIPWAKDQAPLMKPYIDEYNAAVEALENEIPELKAAAAERERAKWADGWKRLRVLFGKSK